MRFMLLVLFGSEFVSGQGFNHQWLLGNFFFFQDPKGRMLVDSNAYLLIGENRKMPFLGTQANISDSNGNLLMSSNGIWIADATGDTMTNGDMLAPSYLTNTWPHGIPLVHGSVFLNFPGDTTKMILFHKSKWGQFSISPTALYESVVDLIQDSVISKNDTILSDTLSWGVGACKHANGQDWWVIVVRDGNPQAYTIKITSTGIDTVFIQSLSYQANTFGNVSPIVFSKDGTKMVYCTPLNQGNNGTVLVYDFNRCSGVFSGMTSYPVSQTEYLFGLSFSPSGRYVYTCSSNYIFQIDTDSQTVDTVASYDGFISPPGSTCCATTFWGMYLAANGKIYITSGSSVQHLHEMNFPDSAGIACDVQQHAIDLVDYLHLRSVPNHPNYYLGCDTTLGCACLTTGIEEFEAHDFKFSISPNPTSNNFSIAYLLPQNLKGKFELLDINGSRVYEMNLPQWSTLQYISLPESVADGIYNCVISSDGWRVSKKLAVIRD